MYDSKHPERQHAMEQERARNPQVRRFLQLEEDQLHTSEAHFRLLAEAIPQIVWTACPNGEVDYYNQRWLDFTGHTPEEALLHGWWGSGLHPDDRLRSLDQWQKSLQSGEPYEIEHRHWDYLEERYRWFLVLARPVYDPQGKIIKWFATCTDVDDLKLSQNGRAGRSSEREQQLLSAIDGANLGVWKFTVATSEIYVSALGKIHLGFSPDEIVDYSMVNQRIFPDSLETLDQSVQRILLEKGIYREEYRILWPDGSLHWIEASGQGQFDEQGRLITLAGATFDITQRKLDEERKDTFIGIASHELKTPLTTVKGFTQLLKRQLRRLGLGDQLTTLNKMEEQINALNRLVSELLDVTKIQAGKLEYIWTEVDLDKLIKGVAESCLQGGVQHSIKVSGSVRHPIIGDKAHLEQVFSNLITNAMKYSPKARKIEIWKGSNEEKVVVKIRDYGIGIPQQDMAHIFDRFYRVDGIRNKSIDGLGMGLYIAQEIVEHHGGKISVESKEEEGSTFYVELPFSFKPEINDGSMYGDGSRSEKSKRARAQPE